MTGQVGVAEDGPSERDPARDEPPLSVVFPLPACLVSEAVAGTLVEGAAVPDPPLPGPIAMPAGSVTISPCADAAESPSSEEPVSVFSSPAELPAVSLPVEPGSPAGAGLGFLGGARSGAAGPCLTACPVLS